MGKKGGKIGLACWSLEGQASVEANVPEFSLISLGVTGR